MRSARGRLFVFSAVKASERARALLVSPAKKMSKQTNNGKKIPMRDSKEFNQQAIEFD